MTEVRALVTGGSRGVGAAVAAALADGGSTAAVQWRGDVAAAETVVSKLPGKGHIVVSGDIADPGHAREIVAETVSALGGVDILVNNAGIYIEHPIASTSYERWQAEWRRIIDVNVFGTANMTWNVVDHLLNRA